MIPPRCATCGHDPMADKLVRPAGSEAWELDDRTGLWLKPQDTYGPSPLPGLLFGYPMRSVDLFAMAGPGVDRTLPPIKPDYRLSLEEEARKMAELRTIDRP